MIAGWLELIDVNNTQQYVARIYSNGAFGPEHRFTPNSSAPPTQALAGTGDAFTFFSGPFPELDAYRSHYDAQGMTWSTPELWLSGGGAGGGSEGSLRVAANARGDAVHVVSGAPQGLRTIFATHYDSALGSWSAVEPLETGAIDSEAVAINDAGDAVAVWLRRDLGPPQLHARALINGVWGPIASIIHGGHRSGASDLEILANGDALVATSSESSVAIRRYSRSAAPGTEWGAPTMLPANIGEAPRLLVDGEGIVTVGWLDGTTGSLRLSVARNLGNGFGVTTDLGPGLTGPTLALDSTGNVSAITRGLPTSVLLTQIAQRGTTWSTPLNVAPTAMDPGRNRSIDVMHDELDHPVVVFDAVTGGVRNLFVTTCR